YGKTTTVIYRDQRLVCQYLDSRATQDKSDRLRQIARAQAAVLAPSKLTGRYRFVATTGQKYSLNSGLVAKAEKLEGIKGYLTNTSLSQTIVINRYHDLWRIEKSFRITKSDLEARPIFHRLDETIKAHLIIVFAGLAISKYIEINTGMSIQRVLKLAGKVLTHKITNTQTGETAYTETTIEDLALKDKIEVLRLLGH
ncbi:MAG: transposase IS4 family protein, partial [Microgenomates group bacterium Gr01-1014_16]